MPLSQFDRDILKSPGYVGTWKDIKPHYRRFPTLAEMTFTKVPNTEITCTHCFGNKIQMVKHINGHLTKEKCAICGGTGKMSNRQDEGA